MSTDDYGMPERHINCRCSPTPTTPPLSHYSADDVIAAAEALLEDPT